MTLLRYADAQKMDAKARKEKLKELKLELVKTSGASKNKAKTKEIKKAISRLLTLANADRRQQEHTK